MVDRWPIIAREDGSQSFVIVVAWFNDKPTTCQNSCRLNIYALDMMSDTILIGSTRKREFLPTTIDRLKPRRSQQLQLPQLHSGDFRTDISYLKSARPPLRDLPTLWPKYLIKKLLLNY